MIGRSVWFAAGAAAGAYGVVKARRVKEALTVDGLRDRAKAATLGARMFREEVARGAADVETGLRERYRIAANGRDGLDGLDTPSLVPREGGSTSKGRLGPGEGGSTTNHPEARTSNHREAPTSNDTQEDLT